MPVTFVAAAYAPETTETAVTQRTVTIPTVQAGDILILHGVSIASTAVHTLAGEMTAFTKIADNARTGITSTLWWRVAVAADSGKTVIVTGDVARPGIAGVAAYRGATGIGTHAILSQASGSTSITLPAFTPSPSQVPLQIIAMANSTALAATLTPPSGVTITSSYLPTGVDPNRRIGLATGANFTPNTAVGNVWTNTGTHYAATWLLPLTVVDESLPAPVLTVTSTNPTGAGLTDGSGTGAWTESAGAAAYESCILAGAVDTGAVSTRSDATLERTFANLAAGTYTAAVRAV